MTLVDEDAYTKVVDVVTDIENVEEIVGNTFLTADSLTTAWQQYFHSLATDWNNLVTSWSQLVLWLQLFGKL